LKKFENDLDDLRATQKYYSGMLLHSQIGGESIYLITVSVTNSIEIGCFKSGHWQVHSILGSEYYKNLPVWCMPAT